MINKEKLLASAQKSLQKGQVTKAIKDYRKVVDGDPKDVRNRQKLAELLVRAKMPKEALDHYESVARYYSENGFYLKAIAVYKQMQRVDPTRIEIYHRLAELNAKQGLVGNALAEYKGLVARYEKEGDLSEALSVLHKMRDIDPDNLNIRIKIADTCVRAGLTSKGLEVLREMIESLREKGDTGKLLKLYGLFQPMFPDEVELQSGYARALVEHGEIARGFALLEDLDQKYPGQVDILNNLAYAARIKGDLGAEIHALAALLEQQPDDLRVRQDFIRAVLRGDQPEQALERLEIWKDDFFDAERSDLLKEFYEQLRTALPEDPRVVETLRSVYQVRGEGDKMLDLVSPGDFSSSVEGDEGASARKKNSESVQRENYFSTDEDSDSDVIEDLPLESLESNEEEAQEPFISLDESDEEVELELELEGDPFADLKPGQSPDTDQDELPALEPDTDQELEMIELPDLDLEETPPQKTESDSETSGNDRPEDFSLDELPDLAFDLDDAFDSAAPQDAAGDQQNSESELPLTEQEVQATGGQESAGADERPPARGDGLSRKEQSRLEGDFSQFKKSVESQIDQSDAETHFNLGIAYKEMGLYEDAVGEFDQATKNAGRRTDALTLKGVCLKEQENFEGALQAFKEALDGDALDDETRCNLFFEIGLLHESRQKPDEALQSFEQVAEIDPFFRNTNDKIKQLRQALGIKDEGKGDDGRVSYV